MYNLKIESNSRREIPTADLFSYNFLETMYSEGGAGLGSVKPT